MTGNWLLRGSPGLTAIAYALAVMAAVATLVYLDPSHDGTWIKAAVALAVLAGPLVARPPLSRGRLLIAVGIWCGLGVAGGYWFGIPVLAAGVLLAICWAASLCRRQQQQPGVTLRPGPAAP